MMVDLDAMGRAAKTAARHLASASTAQKNDALQHIADALDADADVILSANRVDLEAGRASAMSASLLDRLDLQKRLATIAQDVRQVAALPDPVGETFDARTLDNGLRVWRRRTPLGVVGVIYEARPNVTVDVAALTLKTGNAAILRGGKEMLQTNRVLTRVIRAGIEAAGLPADAVQAVDSTDRTYIEAMLRLHQFIDVIIPRGGAALHDFCRRNSTMPVITGGIGICHLFVDETADQDDAIEVILNAKTSRPSVCNSVDTVLVHEKIARDFLPRMIDRLAASGVTFRAEPRAQAAVAGALNGHAEAVLPAGPDDFTTEWMALILGIKVVTGLDEAIAHIQPIGDHSDGILTQEPSHAERFIREIDSAAVFVNASTRFNDGGALGLGAEIAVSTQKLHARGPMGLQELTTYKWVVVGEGHIRT